jgi:hypothetical protein
MSQINNLKSQSFNIRENGVKTFGCFPNSSIILQHSIHSGGVLEVGCGNSMEQQDIPPGDFWSCGFSQGMALSCQQTYYNLNCSGTVWGAIDLD